MNPLSRSIGVLVLFAAPAVPMRKMDAQTSPVAQPQSAAAPVFDVAAIHVYNPQPHEGSHIWSSPSDGHFKAQNVILKGLIHWAFDMPETRILDAPGWVGTTRFSVDATADSSVDEGMHNLTSQAALLQKKKMVQALLADRFKLVVHTETRELPLYELVVAKGGAKLGPAQESGSSVNTSNGRIEVQMANSIAVLAEELSKVAGRDVIDKTGIAGRYDLKLRWTPEDHVPDSDSGASGPSLFTAPEEQLGLRLEPAKGPVQVLVIDHIDMPSQN